MKEMKDLSCPCLEFTVQWPKFLFPLSGMIIIVINVDIGPMEKKKTQLETCLQKVVSCF